MSKNLNKKGQHENHIEVNSTSANLKVSKEMNVVNKTQISSVINTKSSLKTFDENEDASSKKMNKEDFSQGEQHCRDSTLLCNSKDVKDSVSQTFENNEHKKNNDLIDSNDTLVSQERENKISNIKVAHGTASFNFIREFVDWCSTEGYEDDSNDKYPHAPLGEVWVVDKCEKFLNKRNLESNRNSSDHIFNFTKSFLKTKTPVSLNDGTTLLGRRWVWDEGHYTDGGCLTKVSILKTLPKNNTINKEKFVPVSMRAFCDCGRNSGINGSTIARNDVSTKSGLDGPRRSERYGSSVRLSNVSQLFNS